MRTRYRVAEVSEGFLSFSKKQVLILQIFKRWPDGENDWRGMPTYLAGEGWHDASPEDLLELVKLEQEPK